LARDAQDFDAWHADVARSAACDSIFKRALGLPSEMVSNSLLSWAAIAEVATALRLAPGRTLVDLACGRGGYGREMARRTGARLVGLDFSAVAVTIAARGTEPPGPRGRAGFFASDFAAIGLRDHSVDAVMCIDAIQFSDPPLAALGECRRILARGGRLAVTAWEPTGPADQRLPERIRRMNLARDLIEAGFEQVEVTGKPDWYSAERTLWKAAVQADTNGDPALAALQEEGTQALATFDSKRRVLATATAPAI
jgi:ubiquinone/menaquinone biosynthesis C-methylase UbiE